MTSTLPKIFPGCMKYKQTNWYVKVVEENFPGRVKNLAKF